MPLYNLCHNVFAFCVEIPPGEPWHFTESPSGRICVSIGNVCALHECGTVKQLTSLLKRKKTSSRYDRLIISDFIPLFCLVA